VIHLSRIFQIINTPFYLFLKLHTHANPVKDQAVTQFLAADLAALFFDDLAALFFDDLAALFFDDLPGVFLTAYFPGVFFVADFAADFFELFAIFFVFVPDCLAALFFTSDLTGVEAGAGVYEAITGATGFDALLTGVDAFSADCFEADFLLAD
jgi:hypothetical protein